MTLPISVIPSMEFHPRDPEDVAREQAAVEGLRRNQIEMLGDVAKKHWQRDGTLVLGKPDLVETKSGALLNPREAMYYNIMAERAKRQILPEVEKPGWESLVTQGHYTVPMTEPFKQAWKGLVDVSDRASSIPEGVLEGLTDWANEGVPPINAIEKGIAGVFDTRIHPDRDKIYGGLTPTNRFVAEVALDPTNWVGVGALKGGARPFVQAADGVMSKAANAMDMMRYGKGVRTDLVDEAGDVIRRLRNSPEIPYTPPRLEYR